MSRVAYQKVLVLSSSLAAMLSLAGCALGPVHGTASSTDTVLPAFAGRAMGGDQPISGAKVILYATTSTGYGIGQQIAEANQVGTTAHADTDSGGNFTFTNNFTCPANQYVYLAIYGGNTGSGVNPNSLLLSVLGSCAKLYTGTSYLGTNVVVNEYSTVATAYALNNFITVSGNAVGGYTVGIGAPATNNSAFAGGGCVANAYYSGCTTTASPGLRDAFATALSLYSAAGGTPPTTTPNGAAIPFQELNTLADIVQSCVNTTGGGTSATTGAPTSTTTAAGTSHDGTNCGRLFAYTSYTNTGLATGTLTGAGNTVSAMLNLAKRPTGTASTFNSTCDSNSGTGTTTAAACLLALVNGTGAAFQPSMSIAPTEYTLSISYPKGSFSTTANATTCGSAVPATLGVLYPFMIATDINDNLTILNGDASTANCYNLITIGNDGTPLAASAYDASAGATPIWISTDSFGHAIVPVKSTTTENGIRIYGATDTGVPLVTYIAATVNVPTNFPYYTAVDQHDSIFVTAQPATSTTTNNFGYLPVSGTESHATPTYGAAVIFTPNSTSKLNGINIDVSGNAFTTNSSSSGTAATRGVAAGGTVASTVGNLTGSTSNGIITASDASGNVFNIQNSQGTFSNGSPSSTVLDFKQTFTLAGTVLTLAAPTQPNTGLTPGAVKPQNGQIDGAGVIWYTDLQGSTSAVGVTPVVINTSSLHGYDTANNFDTHDYFGCKFYSSTSTACGSQPTDASYPSNSPYDFYGSRGLALDAAGNIWVVNGTLGTVAEVIGLATPTNPLFIHNGSSNKP